MNKLTLTTLLLTTGLLAQTFNVSTTPEFRTALLSATQNGEDDTIVLANGTYTTTDDGLGTFEYLDNEVYDLTLIGSGSENVILDGAEQHRIFRHDSIEGAKLHLEKLTFVHGGSPINDVDNGGGLFANKAALTIVDCNFSNNQAVNGGGFFTPYGNYADVKISNTVFENNRARKSNYASGSGLGGGFYANGSVDINNSSFISNSAGMVDFYAGSGAGFYAIGSATIESSLFYKNSTDGDGGGFFNIGIVEIKDCNFTENSAASLDNNGNLSNGRGGGFISNGGYSINLVTNSVFVKNTAGTEGGGFSILTGSSKILNSSFLENKLLATTYGEGGAGLYANGAISHCIVKDNHSNNNGGGLNFYGVVTNSIFINNYAENKGGAIYDYAGNSYIANSIFAQNSSGISFYGQGTVDNPHILKNNIFLDNNDSIIELTHDEYEQVVSIDNNYINLNQVSVGIRAFKNNNIFDYITLGFVDEANGDYNLTVSSDLIDAGTNDYADKFIVDGVNYLATDFADNNRSVGASMDIGIYEYSTTKPTIVSFTYSGDAKQYQDLTFNVDYNLSNGRTIGSVEYDYTDSGTFEINNMHSFNTIKTYTVNAKVTDSSGEFSLITIRVPITELAYADMTNEQKLLTATNPAYYDDIVSIIDSNIATAISEGKQYVQDNLNEFNLITIAEKDIAVADVNATATATGIEIGKAYVQDNLVDFNLTTLAAYDQAIADTNATATAAGIVIGKDYVVTNLLEFGLITQVASDIAVVTATTTATAAGIVLGESEVITHPLDYNLTTLEDMNASVIAATASGIETGKQLVIASPSSFGIEVAIPLQAADITSLSTGWSMVASPLVISDMSIFNSAKIVWFYNNGTWSAYSSDTATTSALAAASIPTLSTIPVNGSVWVEK